MSEIIYERRTALNAGEISPWLDPRVDQEKYHLACRQMRNMQPTVYGGAFMRPGSVYLGASASHSSAVRLIPFEYDATTTYILEFSDLKMRVWTTGATPALVQSGGSALEVTTLWTAAQLNALQVAQQNDLLFIVHPSHPPQCVCRYSATDWRIVAFVPKWPASLPVNDTETYMAAAWVDGVTDSAWSDATAYVEGNMVTHSGIYYSCRLAHRDREPGVDKDWTRYWAVSSTGTWMNAGGLVNLSASTAVFTADHVGTLWVLSWKRDSSVPSNSLGVGNPLQVLIDIEGDAAGTTTGPMFCLGEWSALTYANDDGGSAWYANVMVERSYDLITWETRQPLNVAKSAVQVLYTGNETAPCYLRMRLVSKSGVLPSPYRAQLEVGNPLQYGIVKITAVQGAASATLANPCAEADDIIDTVADHGLAAGDYITFPTLTGGTGLAANTTYRVHADNLEARTFQVALAADGTTKVLFSTNITAGTVARVAGSSATGIAEFPLDTSTQTKLWMEPAWSAVRGYPRAITLHDSRLWFGGTAYQPATFWGTGLDRYEDFRVSASEDAGKEFTINSEEANIVQWLVAQDGMLVIGTAGSEWSYGQRIGEEIPRLRRISAFGCGAIQARAVSDSMVYVPRSLRKVREMAWNGDRDGFVSPDMSLLAEHLGASAFVQIAIQRAPDNVVWVLTAAGVLLGFIYERTQNVVGWFRHDTDGLIETLACVKGAGEEDEIWLGVKRTIGGATKRFIERFQPDQIRALKDGETTELVYADSAVVQTVSAVTLAESAHADDIIDTATDHGLAVGDYIQFPTLTFGAGGTGLVANTTYRVHADNFAARTFQVALAADGTTKVLWSVANITAGTVKRLTVHGLTHLEGKAVNVLADGVVVTGKTVASGAITLTVPATTVVVGLPYIAYVEPTYLETADPASVTKAFKKRIVRALVEVWKSEGVEISSDAGVTYYDLGTGAALYSGLLETYTDGGTERQASVILRQSKPLPMNLLSLVLRFTLGTA